MKNVMFSLFLVAASFVANATTVTQHIEVGSDNLYRGQSLSNDNGYVEVDFLLNDVFVDGLFVHANASTVELSPLSDTVRSRNEYGIGYTHSLGESFTGNLAVYRVEDYFSYTETRAGVQWSGLKTDELDLVVYSNVGYTVGGGVYNNTYVEVGTVWNDAFTVTGLSLDTKVTGYQYDYNDESRFNNAELTATYNLWKNVDGFATVSYGGNDVLDNDISTQTVVGARWSF